MAQYKFHTPTLLLLVLFTTSCAAKEEPPKEVVDIAISNINRYCLKYSYQCENLKIDFGAGNLTSADRANGIKARWCFRINFASRNKGSMEWKDSSLEMGVAKIGEGNLKVTTFLFYNPGFDKCLITSPTGNVW